MGKTQKYEQVAYLYIKDQILQQKLPASHHIVEASISEKLEMSRSPIRAALGVLTEEGLVEMKPYRGFFVAEVPNTDQDDIVAHRLRYTLILWYRLLDRMVKLDADGASVGKVLDYHYEKLELGLEGINRDLYYESLENLTTDMLKLADHPFLTDEALNCFSTILETFRQTNDIQNNTFQEFHQPIVFYFKDLVRLIKLSRFDDARVVIELLIHYLHNLLPDDIEIETEATRKYEVR